MATSSTVAALWMMELGWFAITHSLLERWGARPAWGEAMAKSLGQAAVNVQGAELDVCGHCVPEERPVGPLAVLLPFGLA